MREIDYRVTPISFIILENRQLFIQGLLQVHPEQELHKFLQYLLINGLIHFYFVAKHEDELGDTKETDLCDRDENTQVFLENVKSAERQGMPFQNPVEGIQEMLELIEQSTRSSDILDHDDNHDFSDSLKEVLDNYDAGHSSSVEEAVEDALNLDENSSHDDVGHLGKCLDQPNDSNLSNQELLNIKDYLNGVTWFRSGLILQRDSNIIVILKRTSDSDYRESDEGTADHLIDEGISAQVNGLYLFFDSLLDLYHCEDTPQNLIWKNFELSWILLELKYLRDAIELIKTGHPESSEQVLTTTASVPSFSASSNKLANSIELMLLLALFVNVVNIIDREGVYANDREDVLANLEEAIKEGKELIVDISEPIAELIVDISEPIAQIFPNFEDHPESDDEDLIAESLPREGGDTQPIDNNDNANPPEEQLSAPNTSSRDENSGEGTDGNVTDQTQEESESVALTPPSRENVNQSDDEQSPSTPLLAPTSDDEQSPSTPLLAPTSDDEQSPLFVPPPIPSPPNIASVPPNEPNQEPESETIAPVDVVNLSTVNSWDVSTPPETTDVLQVTVVSFGRTDDSETANQLPDDLSTRIVVEEMDVEIPLPEAPIPPSPAIPTPVDSGITLPESAIGDALIGNGSGVSVASSSNSDDLLGGGNTQDNSLVTTNVSGTGDEVGSESSDLTFSDSPVGSNDAAQNDETTDLDPFNFQPLISEELAGIG